MGLLAERGSPFCGSRWVAEWVQHKVLCRAASSCACGAGTPVARCASSGTSTCLSVPVSSTLKCNRNIYLVRWRSSVSECCGRSRTWRGARRAGAGRSASSWLAGVPVCEVVSSGSAAAVGLTPPVHAPQLPPLISRYDEERPVVTPGIDFMGCGCRVTLTPGSPVSLGVGTTWPAPAASSSPLCPLAGRDHGLGAPW